jgi:hypothetical protein
MHMPHKVAARSIRECAAACDLEKAAEPPLVRAPIEGVKTQAAADDISGFAH